MSEDDKQAQVGAAVMEYQAAKLNLAHVERGMQAVASAYRAFGNALENDRDRIKIVDDFPSIEYSTESSNRLMNGAELAKLVNERNAAVTRKESA